ncbi:MAG: D-lyxose/D-mannose family sugar isomerase [bacterium]|nr:cupin domain-containing protein [Candidatus Sumerlaeota bacterium]
MDQLALAQDKNKLPKELRDEVIEKVKSRFAHWGYPLTKHEIIVTDFGLGDFWRVGLVENWMVNDTSAGYCGKYLFLFANQTCPKHRHKDKRETFIVMKGLVRMEYDGRVLDMLPGDVLTVERWNDHRFTGLVDSLIIEVSQPSIVDDNYFADRGVCYGKYIGDAETE